MDYNPNGVWESKEKKYSYEPKSTSTPATEKKGSPVEPPDSPSFFSNHRHFFFSAVLIIGLCFILLVIYLLIPAAAPDITISFSNPGQVVVGTPFPLSITVTNDSKSTLKNTDLSIVLPDGISFAGQAASQRVMDEQLDTINSKTTGSPQTVSLVVTGDTGTSQNVNIKLVYQTSDSGNSQFETDGATIIPIGQSAMTVTYDTPSDIFSGQNFPFTVNYKNDTGQTLEGVQFEIQYPPAYTYVSSTITPTDAEDDVWNLGTVGPNATGSFSITGNIVGPVQSAYQVIGTTTANFSGQNYPVVTAPATFVIASSPLTVSIVVNGSSSYVTKPGDSLNYDITYKNNSNLTFQGVNISAALNGQMFKYSSVQSNGSFNSQNNVVTWYAANTPALSSVLPGQSGEVNFSISTPATLPAALLKNYVLTVTAQIQSPTVPANTAGTSTISTASINTDVGGQIAIAAKGYFHDPTAAIKNSGPYPPEVNQPTEYTIHWDITNYSTDAKNVTVSAYLQSGTTLIGMPQSTGSSSPPTYNPTTGLITWSIPFVPAATGLITPTNEAIFQVSNTPAINQVGQPVTLLGRTTITATDAFTGNTLQSAADPVTTALPYDKSIPANPGNVIQ